MIAAAAAAAHIDTTSATAAPIVLLLPLFMRRAPFLDENDWCPNWSSGFLTTINFPTTAYVLVRYFHKKIHLSSPDAGLGNAIAWMIPNRGHLMMFGELLNTYMDFPRPMGSPISAILKHQRSSTQQYIIFIHETEKTNNWKVYF